MSAREAIESLQAAYLRVRGCGEPNLDRRERAISAVESAIASAVSELAELDRQLAEAVRSRAEAEDVGIVALTTVEGERDRARDIAKALAHAYETDNRPPPYVLAEVASWRAR